MTTEQTIVELVNEFDSIPDWEERYAHIIALGKRLTPYPEAIKIDKYKVAGCQSQVWLHAQKLDDSGNQEPEVKVHFDAESDAAIVKGIIAILMRIYNNRTPDEILNVSPDFVQRLGLNQHLSVNRTNGLVKMVKQIQMYAIAFRGLEESRNRGIEESRNRGIEESRTMS